MAIKNLPKTERPYEKLAFYGAQQLTDAELLAIIIKAGTKDKTAKDLIYDLMNQYDYQSMGLSFLNEVSLKEIQEIKGLGEIKAIQLKAIAEIAKRMTKPATILKHKINAPEDVATVLMEDMRYLKQEKLVSILLNSKNEMLKIVTNAIGGINASVVQPREVFKEPIKWNAAKLILVHNHPSRQSLSQ